MAQRETVFQKLFKGDLPSWPIYANRRLGLFSFLDIYPAAPGHVVTAVFDAELEGVLAGRPRYTAAVEIPSLDAHPILVPQGPVRLSHTGSV